MGITGLLPLLKPITKAVHIDKYEGKTIVIDGYSWIHKGIYGSALDLLEGKATRKYIDYCLTRAKFLLEHRIKVIFVFDGGHLPMKALEEEERRARREENKKIALKALKKGDRSTAWQYANKSANVTPEMANRLMLELRQANIPFLVAPYEADAQMAYLCQKGIADAVITEDSDMLLFECPIILYKFNIADGFVEEIRLENLQKVKRDLDFQYFTPQMLRYMCILSGCDYLPSLPKMGLKTAHRFVKTFVEMDKILNAIRASGQFIMPDSYETNFMQADMTFLFARVFCPTSKMLVHLNEDKEGRLVSLKDTSFLGPFLEQHIAVGIAHGMLCPVTFQPFKHGSENKENVPVLSTKVKPTVLSGTEGREAITATGSTQKKVEFWERVTLKRPAKTSEGLASKKANQKVEIIIDKPKPIKSPYFEAANEMESVRRSPRIQRIQAAGKGSSELVCASSTKLYQKFYEKENGGLSGAATISKKGKFTALTKAIIPDNLKSYLSSK